MVASATVDPATGFGPSTLKGVGAPPPSPSPDRPAYRSMEPSYPDASLWGRRGRPCAVHGWGPCPNRVALAHVPLSSGQQGEAVREEDELHQILTVTGLVQASLTHRMARISISPRGQHQGPLALRTTRCAPRRHLPFSCLRHRRFHQLKLSLRSPVRRYI
jgi:hypothetical protein